MSCILKILTHFLFSNFKSRRKESALIFVCFGLFSEIWPFYGFYPITAAKVYLTVHFPKFWLGIFSYSLKFCLLRWKCLPVTGNFFLWPEISSCDRKFLPVTRNFFLWQKISSCDRKFLTVKGNVFLWQEISSSERKFFSFDEQLKKWLTQCFCVFVPSLFSFSVLGVCSAFKMSEGI